MIKNYFLIALRSFWKNRTTSIIKIAGLSIGLSAVLLIYIYTSFQYSYDKYHNNGDRIYRVAYHITIQNGKHDEAKTGHNLAPLLKNNFPEIENAARISYFGDVNIIQHNQKFTEKKFLFADSSLLQMFSFPMKTGDPQTALNEKGSIIISSKVAKKYFGNENPIGKFLDDNLQLKITGIMDVPDNSHFRFDILASYPTIYHVIPFYKNRESDFHNMVYTYVMLRKGNNSVNLEKKFPEFAKTYIKSDLYYLSTELFLEPLKDIQLKSRSEAYYGELNLTRLNLIIISLFSFLGLIIIVIGCFNFINISVAHTASRTREIGIRIIFGAKKIEIFFQFIFEYWLYSLIAVLISTLIVHISLPLISTELNRQIEVNYLRFTIVSSAVMLVITIFAGAYPSLIVAKVNPIKAMQNGLKGPSGNVLQTILIVSQFTVSIILLLMTFFISKQIRHFSSTDVVGINTRNLLVIKMDHSTIRKNYELLKSELLRNPAILSVSASSNIPAVTGSNLSNIKIEDGIQVNIPFISIDADFTNNLGIKLLEGRDFKSGPQSDSRSAFLLNKTAIEQLGIKNPVGKNIILYRDQNGISIPYWSGQIIGVVNDYAYRPAYDQSSGVLFCNDPGRFNAMFIRINSDKQNESISFVKQTWEKMFSDIPFSADFLEDEIENDIVIQLFYTVQKFIIAAAIFSFILALLGLFGLSIISATQKVKEIGIRRVNGASVGKILVLMNRKFIEMVLLSFAISIPIVYFMAEEVKKEQANSTNLSIQNYGIAFLLILIISFSVVSWQGWKTAKRNPVETLRYE